MGTSDPEIEAAAEALAERFHVHYERLAPEHGYETRKASAVPWEQVPERNRRLMIATCAAVLREARAAGALVGAADALLVAVGVQVGTTEH